jgi:hypothetical protein
MTYKKIYVIIVIYIIYSNTVTSQTISGKVTDVEKCVVQYAVVTLIGISDSSVVSYANTDKDGYFSMKSPENGDFLLRVNNLAYKVQEKKISINNNSVEMNFVLEKEAVILNEVTIGEHHAGIHFGQDTIRYNPKAFTDGSEVVLGDVLDKLPGIEVDSRGSIKARGKQVDKLLVNGQDFFANNPQMATKNLPADIAESVEVLNNYSEYSLLTGFQSNEQTAINIGVNKNMLGKISGNIMAGGGIENKYKTNGNLMNLASKSMVALLGAQNNTGEQVFTMEDYIRLQGGINGVLSNDGRFELTENEARLLMPSDNTYSKTDGLSALNVSYQPNQKFKFNSYALFNKNRSEAEDINLYTYNLQDKYNYILRENTTERAKTELFSGYLKTNYNPSSTLSLVYNGNISNSKMNRAYDVNSTTNNREDRKINSLRTKHQILLIKTIGKHVFFSNAGLSYSSNPFEYTLKTDSLLLAIPVNNYDSWYYGRQNTDENQFLNDFSVTFLFRINKIYHFRSVSGIEIKKQNYTSLISEDISLNDSLCNDLNYTLYDYFENLELIKNKGVFRFKFGTSVHGYKSFGNIFNNISSEKFQINPLIELSLIFSEKHRLITTFKKSVETNPLKDFNDKILIDNYKSYFSSGNPDFLNNQYLDLSLFYNMFDLFSNTVLVFNGNYRKTKHSVTKNYTQNGVLSVANTVTSRPKENLYANLTLDKGLGFIPWKLKYKGNFMQNKYFYHSEKIENKVKSYNISNLVKIESRYFFPLNTEIYFGYNYINTSISSGYGINQTILNCGGKLKYKLNSRFYADAEFQFMNNKAPNYSQDKHIVNGNIRYRIKKNIEIQLRGYNVLHLHEQKWSRISYSNNYSLEQFYRQIPGNITFSIKYII